MMMMMMLLEVREEHLACKKSPQLPTLGFTAFSLPGQFTPWSESANRTLANSLPET